MLRGAPPGSVPSLPLAKLPGYELLAPLGKGGMGQVYKARQVRLDRLVAVKMIRPELMGQAETISRFQREARAAARMSHPNIVAVHDATEHAGNHWLVMEYVEGTDLATVLKNEGPLPIAVACDYARQVALGLEHARTCGLVHRDIKPSNLLVTADRRTVKILDMGLARFVQANEASRAAGEATQSGVLLGTPAYLAPEQALDSRRADTRSDIYSLGCTLYQLLTGRVPFPAESLTAIVLKHQAEEPEPVTRLRQDMPAELESVVTTMMAKRPDDRYQTPGEVAQVLESFASRDTSLTAPSPRRASMFRHMVRSSRARWLVSLVVVSIVGILLAWSLFPGLERTKEASPSKEDRVEAPTEKPRDFRKALYHFNEGQALRLKGYPTYEHATAVVKAFSAAIDHDPMQAKPYYGRGEAYLHMRQYDEAIADLKKCLTLNPPEKIIGFVHARAGNAYHNRAAFGTRDRDNYQRAIEHYSAALERFPNEEHIFVNRGVCHASLQQYDSAIADYTRAHKLNAKETRNLTLRAECQERQGNILQAIADLELALKINAAKAHEWNPEIDTQLARLRAQQAPDVAPAVTGRTPRDELLKEGYRHFEARRFYLAAKSYTEALKLDPESPLAYNQRGFAHLYTRDFGRALDDFTQLVRINQKLGKDEAHDLVGLAFLGLREYDQAIERFSDAIHASGNRASFLYARAAAYRGKGDAVKEKADLAAAFKASGPPKGVTLIAGDSDAKTPWVSLAKAFAAGRHAEVITGCTEAIERNPASVSAYNLRGMAYLVSGNADKALADFDQLVRLRDRAPDALKNGWAHRALAYLARGDLNEAIDDLGHAIALDRTNPNLYQLRHDAFMRATRFDRALGERERGQRLGPVTSPGSTPIEAIDPASRKKKALEHYRRAIADFEEQRLDDALKNLNEALRFDLDLAGAYCLRGGILAQRGDPTAAIADFTELVHLSLPPTLLNAYALRGYAYLLKGDDREAAAELSEALEIVGGHPQYLRWRALAYEKAGDNAKAQADRDAAKPKGSVLALQMRSVISVRRPVGPHVALYTRSRVAAVQGRIEEAIALATEAIKLYPDFAAAYNHRAFQHRQLKDLKGAIADFTEMIRCNDDVPNLSGHDHRAGAYLAMGDFDRAIADYTAAIEANPLNSGLYLARASAYQSRGDFSLAAADRSMASRHFIQPAPPIPR